MADNALWTVHHRTSQCQLGQAPPRLAHSTFTEIWSPARCGRSLTTCPSTLVQNQQCWLAVTTCVGLSLIPLEKPQGSCSSLLKAECSNSKGIRNALNKAVGKLCSLHFILPFAEITDCLNIQSLKENQELEYLTRFPISHHSRKHRTQTDSTAHMCFLA